MNSSALSAGNGRDWEEERRKERSDPVYLMAASRVTSQSNSQPTSTQKVDSEFDEDGDSGIAASDPDGSSPFGPPSRSPGGAYCTPQVSTTRKKQRVVSSRSSRALFQRGRILFDEGSGGY